VRHARIHGIGRALVPWLWSARAHVQEMGGDGGKEMELQKGFLGTKEIFVYSRLLEVALAGLAITVYRSARETWSDLC
jgi:hypothetical protein